jgi:hypothetical protein
MTALRERPRVVLVQVLGLILLLAVGVVAGMALKPDPAPKTPASVQRQVHDLRSQRAGDAAAARRTQARQARTIRVQRRQLRAQAVRERRLRRALARARR